MSSLLLRLAMALATVCLACAGCAAAPPGCAGQDPATCTRILFIGNSYTYVNDLPSVFARLALSGGHRVETGMAAVGGATFADQIASPDTLSRLAGSKWNVVVLQEQSQIPAAAQSRAAQMYPAARLLVHRVQGAGAEPVLFVTWAYRDGWPEDGLPGFEGMQTQIDAGYRTIADELHVGVVPVGDAWAAVHAHDPAMDLWQADGSHPTMTGTYLAACVFYASIFHQTPAGLGYTADLPAETVSTIQSAAAEFLVNPAGWTLP